MNGDELKYELAQFYGGDQVYCHALVKSFNYTSGFRCFLQNAGGGAYWFSDILATVPQIRIAVMEEGFFVAVLKVVGTVGNLVVARDESSDGGYDSVAYTQTIDYTDCPEGEWKFYLSYTMVGSKPVILAMLPKEY